MASSNPKIPYVKNGVLHRHDGATICAVTNSLADKTGWYDWLENPLNKSFAFVASNGAHCTVVKEKRTGTSGKVHYYWIAYRSVNWKKRRVSLGKSYKINLAKLSEAATRLAQLELVEAPSGDPQAPAGEAGVTRRSRSRDASSGRSPKPEALSFGTL